MNHTPRSGLLALAAAGLAATAAAQDLAVKLPPQSRPVLITGATVHTMAGRTIQNGAVMFNNGVISGVFTQDELADFQARVLFQPPGPERLDAGGKHVYPGMIAVASQIGLTEILSTRPTEDYDEVGAITPEARPASSINPDSTLLPVTRAAGVLAAGVFPTGGLIPGQVSVIRFEGWTAADMIVRESVGVLVNWPAMRPAPSLFPSLPEGEQRKEIRSALDAIDRAFGAARSYAEMRRADPATPRDIRWDAMAPLFAPQAQAAPPRPRVFVAANDVDQITAAVTFAAEHGVDLVIVGGRDAPLCAPLLKQHNVPVIVTTIRSFPKRADADYDAAFRVPAELHKAGLRFCIASGEEPAHERNLPYAAGMACAFGLPIEDGLRSITASTAEILGVADTLGTLEAGKAATLFIADGNPMEITTRVERIFIDGKAVSLENKQTALERKYREKYAQPSSERPPGADAPP